MRKGVIEYDHGIPQADLAILEEKKKAFLLAFMSKSLFWELHLDSKGRRHYRAVELSDRLACLCQVTIQDIADLEEEELKVRLVAGAFPKREIC